MNQSKSGVITGDDGVKRCWWCGSDPLYVDYHDHEWGMPVVDDTRLFEKMCLEGFQAGLSWITVLKKRPAFREVFHGFEIDRVAKMTSGDVDKLVQDARIIRHRGKIESTINNAARAIELIEQQGSLATFFWSFEPSVQHRPGSVDQVPAKTDESTQMSKALKKLGWTFVGPTTCYALMQAMGMVNDHLKGCQLGKQVDQARKRLPRKR